MPSKKPKIVVVGGGVAGSMAALKAAERGAGVSLITILPPRRSGSVCIRDGINAAVDTKGEGDSPALHARETILCGDFLAHQGPVKAMCDAAPAILGLFDRMGAVFRRTCEGTVELHRSCGSSKRRTALGYGGTGRQLMSVLDSQIRRQASSGKARPYEGWEFLSLVLDDGGACRGVVAANLRNMEIKAFAADAVVVCTGGFAGLWGRGGANPAACGAAIAACYEQGAHFANPEFVEIHPFTMAFADKGMPVCDAVLSAGGRVSVPRDANPWHFLEDWFPSLGGMVPRDVAARAIRKMVHEMGHGVEGGDAVHLDVSGVDPEWLGYCLADALEFYGRAAGVDPMGEPFKVRPAVYKTLGGLWIGKDHATNIPGLFAAGGAACQHHGASTLSGNELLSSACGGMAAGDASVEYATGPKRGSGDVPASLLEAAKTREEDKNAHLLQREGEENARLLAREISDAVAAGAAIEKDNRELSAALGKIREFKGRFARAKLLDGAQWENAELPFMRRLAHSFELAGLVVAASIARDESRGSHFKPEFPRRDDKKWLVTTRAAWTPDGPRFDYSEKIEILDFEPGDRKYG